MAVLPRRADAGNSATYAGDSVAAPQRTGSPDLKTAILAISPEATLVRARDAGARMEWELVAADSAAGRVEKAACCAHTWNESAERQSDVQGGRTRGAAPPGPRMRDRRLTDRGIEGALNRWQLHRPAARRTRRQGRGADVAQAYGRRPRDYVLLHRARPRMETPARGSAVRGAAARSAFTEDVRRASMELRDRQATRSVSGRTGCAKRSPPGPSARNCPSTRCRPCYARLRRNNARAIMPLASNPNVAGSGTTVVGSA